MAPRRDRKKMTNPKDGKPPATNMEDFYSHFYSQSLSAAATELDLSVDLILQLAAQKQVTVSIPIPGDVAIWQRQDPILQTGSIWRTTHNPHFKLLSLDSSTCDALRGGAELKLSPLFSDGYLKPPGEVWQRHTPPPMWRSKSADTPPPGYPVREVDISSLPEAASLGRLKSLIAMREDKPCAIVVSQDLAVIHTDEISRYLDDLLPLPESELIIYPTTTQYLVELDEVARQMYALGKLRKNHYPAAPVISEAIRKKPSFAHRVANISIESYKDIVDTARIVITPEEITKRGKRVFDPDRGYVSPYLKVMMDVSYELHNSLSITSVGQLIDRLKYDNIPASLAERCPPLLLPRQPASRPPT